MDTFIGILVFLFIAALPIILVFVFVELKARKQADSRKSGFSLGPWWPNQENIERWTQKWKLELPTDNPQVARYVVNFLFAAYGFYKAWETYENPTKTLWRFERTAYTIAGINGVIAFWLFLAIACLAYGTAAYGKTK